MRYLTIFFNFLINLTYNFCQCITKLRILTLWSSALRTPTTHISNVNLDNMVNASWRNGFRCVASYRLFIHIYVLYMCCDYGDTCNICRYLWSIIDVLCNLWSLCNICLTNRDYVSNNQYSVNFSSTFFFRMSFVLFCFVLGFWGEGGLWIENNYVYCNST